MMPGDADERTMEPGSPGTWEPGNLGAKLEIFNPLIKA